MGGIEREPTETRPWGCFYVIDEGAGYKVKRIEVRPQGRLSLQSHKHRREHWIFVAGEATVTIGESVRTMKRGETTEISRGDRHRLENLGSEDVVLIEVQFGDYLGEDDIVRYEDAYNRV
jgi:mannose-1-phosphate guanylyltransferase